MVTLFLGNHVAKYHPSDPVRIGIENILRESVIDCEGPDVLTDFELSMVDLCICYLEFGQTEVSPDQAEALIEYIENGGVLLVLHNGISLQSNPRLAQMIGAEFQGHPPYETLPELRYSPEPVHEITREIRPFIIPEEAYQFRLLTKDLQIFLTYEYEGNEYPAGWCRSAGKGKLIYLAPGHRGESFDSDEMKGILKHCVQWLTGREV